MQNLLTVTLGMPWLPALEKKDFDKLYSELMDLSQNQSRLSSLEARHVISGMSHHEAEYSYDAPVMEIDFGGYANLTKYLPDNELHVRVGKVGAHVQSDQRDNPNYFNVVDIDFSDGHMTKQVLSHLDDIDGELKDSVVLEGGDMKSRFLSLKSVAVRETEKFVSRVPVLNPQIVQKDAQSDRDFSL